MLIFNKLFSASTTLRRENNRLKPWSGLIRLSLGFKDSPLTSSLVWAKVATTARMAVTPRKGPATMTTAMTQRYASCLSMEGAMGAGVSAMKPKQAANRPSACSETTLPMTFSITRLPIRVATAITSLLIMTLPFFRSSRRFLGVAFSVLESPGTVHPPFMLSDRSIGVERYRVGPRPNPPGTLSLDPAAL